MKVTDKGLESSIVKFFPTDVKSILAERMKAQPGDLLLFVADKPALVASTLCDLRLRLGTDLGLLDDRVWNPLWVVRFPLVEYDTTEKRYVACHHPFTAPVEEDLEKMESDPSSVRARAYDLVLNGSEIAGGSIRIYRRDVQDRMFNLLGISPDEAERKFGFLLEAFEYGAPPHGGIAFGFDRMVSLLAGGTFYQGCDRFSEDEQRRLPYGRRTFQGGSRSSPGVGIEDLVGRGQPNPVRT